MMPTESKIDLRKGQRRGVHPSAEGLPCLIYEAATPALTIIRLSGAAESNFTGLINSQIFWDWVFEEDVSTVEAKLCELSTANSISFLHRMLNDLRLPVWVAHCVQKQTQDNDFLFRGCITPILNDGRVFALDQALAASFIHKLGNHFQLLNLVSAALSKTQPQTRDAEILSETLEAAAEITRSFADCLQTPSGLSYLRLTELLKAALQSICDVLTPRISVEERYEQALGCAKVFVDGFLLESVFSSVINDLTDSAKNETKIRVVGAITHRRMGNGVAKLEFFLGASGSVDDMALVEDCIRARKQKESLRLSMAKRLVEMHGGFLRNKMDRGAIEIFLPVTL